VRDEFRAGRPRKTFVLDHHLRSRSASKSPICDQRWRAGAFAMIYGQWWLHYDTRWGVLARSLYLQFRRILIKMAEPASDWVLLIT
jgi:hypothetical protein